MSQGNTIPLYDVVTKLVGPIQPLGETNADAERLENLKAVAGLVDRLITDVDRVAGCRNQTEHSVRESGEFANQFLTDLGIGE